MKIENATVRRSLGDSEQIILKTSVRKLTELRTQRAGASAGKAAQLDTEIRRLNDQCEAIYQGAQ